MRSVSVLLLAALLVCLPMLSPSATAEETGWGGFNLGIRTNAVAKRTVAMTLRNATTTAALASMDDAQQEVYDIWYWEDIEETQEYEDALNNHEGAHDLYGQGNSNVSQGNDYLYEGDQNKLDHEAYPPDGCWEWLVLFVYWHCDEGECGDYSNSQWAMATIPYDNANADFLLTEVYAGLAELGWINLKIFLLMNPPGGGEFA